MTDLVEHKVQTVKNAVSASGFARHRDSCSPSPMAGKALKQLKKDWALGTSKRLKLLLKLIDWDKDRLAKELMGPKPSETQKKMVENWLERNSVDSYWIAHISSLLGVDVGFLMQTRDDLDSCIERVGLFRTLYLERAVKGEVPLTLDKIPVPPAVRAA